MSTERQGQVVFGTRGVSGQLDEDFNALDGYKARYDILNLETPNFAAGFFNTTQEIDANTLLGVFNSYNALTQAAPSQWAAFRAALRKARS